METTIKTAGMTPALAKALAKFHEDAPEINLDKEVNTGKFKYTYASLSHILALCRPVMKDAGLSFTQILDNTKVTTMLICTETGDFIESNLEIKASADPKQQGSAITYARRYALVAILGIMADEDTDAPEAADKGKPAMSEKHLLQAINRTIEKEENLLQNILDTFTLQAEQVMRYVDALGTAGLIEKAETVEENG
jgi:hypothetical protein